MYIYIYICFENSVAPGDFYIFWLAQVPGNQPQAVLVIHTFLVKTLDHHNFTSQLSGQMMINYDNSQTIKTNQAHGIILA